MHTWSGGGAPALCGRQLHLPATAAAIATSTTYTHAGTAHSHRDIRSGRASCGRVGTPLVWLGASEEEAAYLEQRRCCTLEEKWTGRSTACDTSAERRSTDSTSRARRRRSGGSRRRQAAPGSHGVVADVGGGRARGLPDSVPLGTAAKVL